MQLEGYEYDLTADLLTARVLQSNAGAVPERVNVEVSIYPVLRSLLEATVSELEDVLEATRAYGQTTE